MREALDLLSTAPLVVEISAGWCCRLVSSSWVSAFVALAHMMTAMGGFFFPLSLSLIPL